ncbi:hypothetical protein R1flu_004048 [Riccia fluitans]|uniref:HMA domain-containing protein n=1 Tax=Riccia fluitans TaxID=41844 RepID=A0ABD1YP67_9MARC
MEDVKILSAPAEPDPAPPDTATDEKKEVVETNGEDKPESEEEGSKGEVKMEVEAKAEEKQELEKEPKEEETKKEEPPAPPSPPDPVLVKLKVPFCCEACKEKVRAIFKVLNGVESVTVDSASGLVTITGNVQSEECLNLAQKVKKRAAIL